MLGAVSHIDSHAVQVIIGVDTHKDQHVAVAIDERGVRLDEKLVPAATCGYEELERWSCALVPSPPDIGTSIRNGLDCGASYNEDVAEYDRKKVQSGVDRVPEAPAE